MLYVNSTASAITVAECNIKAYPVERASGDRGFIHDFFVDYESVQKNGEQRLEWGNNYVINKDQTKKIATYLWKWHTQKKHIYTVSIPGVASYFEPGEWYELRLGAAGTQEYVDAVVECYAVRVNLAPGSVGRTSVSFRVVEQNFRDDSNAVTRYMASGGLARIRGEAVVTVAPRYSGAKADFYCDGTDDQVEINAAINALSDGGKVVLLRGTFYTGAGISLLQDVALVGEIATFIDKNGDYNAISAVGSAGAYLDNLQIKDITILRNSADTYNKSAIVLQYCKNSIIDSVTIHNPKYVGVFIDNSQTITVRKVTVRNTAIATASSVWAGIAVQQSGQYCVIESSAIYSNYVYGGVPYYGSGIYVGSSDSVIVTNNSIYQNNNAGTSLTVAFTGVYSYRSNLCTFKNNNVRDFGTASTVSQMTGIDNVQGYRNVVESNTISVMKSGGGYGVGIQTSDIQSLYNGNYCYNNGRDTGIANTNTDNFYINGATSTMTNINSWQ